MHYYKFNIADWNLGTAHLSLEEEAIYLRLVNFYYDSENPIPIETKSVFRRLRMGPHSEIAALILDEFFEPTDNGWIHKRCDNILKDYRKTTKKNKANGAKGGRPSNSKGSRETQNKPTGLPNESQNNPNQEPLTTNQEPLTKETGQSPPSTEIADISKHKFTDQHLQLAIQLAAPVRISHPSQKININAWADDIRKLIDIDKRTEQQILYLWDWRTNHRNGSFSWADNCRTPGKLRERKDGLPYFDLMANQIRAEHTSEQEQTDQYKVTVSDQFMSTLKHEGNFNG